jgi:hypothetical protein
VQVELVADRLARRGPQDGTTGRNRRRGRLRGEGVHVVVERVIPQVPADRQVGDHPMPRSARSPAGPTPERNRMAALP